MLPEPADHQLNQYTTTPFDTRQSDENGNLLSINAGQRIQQFLAYDYRNRMITYANGMSVIAGYAYDPFGRRIQSRVDDGTPRTIRFLLQGWQEIEETDGSGVTQATYVFGSYVDEAITVTRTATSAYYHSDQIFSIYALSDMNAAALERYDYTDFGQAKLFRS